MHFYIYILIVCCSLCIGNYFSNLGIHTPDNGMPPDLPNRLSSLVTDTECESFHVRDKVEIENHSLNIMPCNTIETSITSNVSSMNTSREHELGFNWGRTTTKPDSSTIEKNSSIENCSNSDEFFKNSNNITQSFKSKSSNEGVILDNIFDGFGSIVDDSIIGVSGT